MKRRAYALAFAAVAVLAAAAASSAFAQEAAFTADQYYVFPLQGGTTDLDALSMAVQSQGFSVVRYEDNSAVVYEGSEISTRSVALVLEDPQLLVLDGSRFLLRVRTSEHVYTARPARNGLELVFSPIVDQTLDDLVSVLFSLQSLSVIGSEVDFGYESYAKESLKGPAPPAGLPLDSTLYALTVAEDWFSFAASKGISLVGLRVDVVAEIEAGSLIPAEYFGYVVGESESLVKLLLPIDLLVDLAESPEVTMVRPPYQPVIP